MMHADHTASAVHAGIGHTMTLAPLHIAALALAAALVLTNGISPTTAQEPTPDASQGASLAHVAGFDPAAIFIGTRSTGRRGAPGGAWLSASGQLLETDALRTVTIGICPGNRLAVQVGREDGADGDVVVLRDLQTLEVVERFDAPSDLATGAVSCRTEDASAISLIDHTGAYDARSETQLAAVDWDPDRPIEASGHRVVGQAYDPDADSFMLELLDLDAGTVTPVAPVDLGYALGPDGDRLATLRSGRRRHELAIFDLTSIGTGDAPPEASLVGRRPLPQGFVMAVSADEAMGAPLYLSWVDSDRVAYVRSEQADLGQHDLGRVAVIDGADLSTLCTWRGWNVPPVGSADGVLLGAGGRFRTTRRPPRDRDPEMIVFELRRRSNGRRPAERFRIADSIVARDASGSPAVTFRVKGAEPTGTVVPLPGFDTEALFGERSAGCRATSDEAVVEDEQPSSRRELEDALRARLAPIECQRWRQADEPFEFGAVAAVRCDQPGLGVDQLALFQFPDRRSLKRFWSARTKQLDLRRRPRACIRTPGITTWKNGQIACYTARGSDKPKIRWIDRSERTYGVLDFWSTHWDIDVIRRWWQDNLLPPPSATAAAAGRPQVATSRPKVPVQRRPFDAWMFTDEDPSGGGGNATWRDRADDEDGYRVYARRTWTTPGCEQRRGPFRRIDRLPADTQRYRPDHRAVLRRLPEPRRVWTDHEGRAPVTYDLFVAAFNEAGESRKVKAGSYSWGLAQCGFDV